MGNHRFRLSAMIPNAWFYKLKDMGTRSTTKSQNKKHPLPPLPPGATSLPSPPQPPKPHRHLHLHQLHPRQSYHFTRDDSPPDPFHYNLAPSHLPDPPRKSARKRKSTNKIKTNYSKMSNSPRLVTTSVSADCSCRASLESVWTKPDSTTEEYPNSTSSENESLFNMPSWSPPYTPCSCNHKSETVDQQKFETPDLPPIITKKTEPTRIRKTTTKIEARNYANGSLSVKVAKEDNIVGISQKEQRSTPPVKKFSGGSSPGMKLRTNSPRIGTRKVHHINHRKSVSSIPTSGGSRRSDGFAVVKSSKDPHRDFKESMVEMIMQNEIKASKDLEDLLACYLSLNSDEYHDMIIKVFKQIWFDTVDIRLN